MRSKAFYFLFIPIIFLFFSFALGSGEKIPWSSTNGGGGIYSSSTNYKLCGSVAQSVAGKDTSTGTVPFCYSGFWNPWVRKTTPVEWEEVGQAELPKEFDLRQNYPNPFNPNTVIEYALPKSAHVTIEIYNLLGKRLMFWWMKTKRSAGIE